MQTWQEKAIAMYKQGMSKAQIGYALHDEIGAPTPEASRNRVNRFLYTVEGLDTDHPKVKEKPPKRVAIENLTPKRHSLNWDGCETIRFGLVSDTHINSKYTQLTHLHRFYDICAELGIDKVFHAGDIDEGEQMRVGHAYECYEQGGDDHIAEIVRVYPKRDGITTYFITGNHDASLYKHAGVDIGKAVADKRPDMVYLGRDCAVVNLTDNCPLQLRHPWDGSSKSISQKPQQLVDAMEQENKPKFIVVGHYHKAGYFFYRGVHMFLPACLQSHTPHSVGKNLTVQMGGWTVECAVDKNGNLKYIVPQFFPFNSAIKDDYLNWRKFQSQ